MRLPDQTNNLPDQPNNLPDQLPSLEKLRINACETLTDPIPLFPRLRETFHSLARCSHTWLRELSCLKKLAPENMRKVKEVSLEFCRNVNDSFRSLKVIKFTNMAKLENRLDLTYIGKNEIPIVFPYAA